MIKLLVIIGVLACASIKAQTILPTSFSVDTFLSVANSPYLATSTVVINSGITVQFEKGCSIFFDEGKAFNVAGTLKLIGEENDSIILATNTGASFWGPITANYGNLIFDCVVLNSPKRIISASHGVVNIKNSRISAVIGAIGEDGIAIHYADSVIFTDNILESNPDGGKIDGIDADGINYGNISNNTIRNWPDDGIDIGSNSQNVTISNNIIYNVDFGLSVGESSTVFAERNIIYDSYAGIQSHTGAVLTTDHNTIFNVVRSLQPHHGSSSNSGGTLIVTNTIMNSASYADYTTQSNSTLTISYCVSNKDTLPGVNNIFADALFEDTLTYNFNLTENSPCIDSGDPNYTGTFNGLRTDIGVYEFDTISSTVNMLSNELSNISIFPNPADEYLNVIIKSDVNYLEIYDINGKSLEYIHVNSNNFKIDVSYLKSGVYVLKTERESIRFIKK